ncbi:MAG: hypothetical protein ACLGSD_01980 [Acidobacteriota bacterium]
MSKGKGFIHAFWDWFVLFSGISTVSNLSRTRRTPVISRGLFIFRRPEKSTAADASHER